MAISNVLMNSILAMDSYNRGYNSGIGPKEGGLGDAKDTKIGNAIILGSKGDLQAQNANFYAIAYSYNGEKIISYRGTDQLVGDAVEGWITGAGVFTIGQAPLAAAFYKDVIKTADPYSANVSFTGHSLGGGLAGLMADVYHKNAITFDNMPFELAASHLYDRSDPNHPDHSDTLVQSALDVYYFNNATPLAPRHTNPNHNTENKIDAYATTGEMLGGIRGAQSTNVTYLDSHGGFRDPISLHSQALLTTLMFAREENLATDWEKAGGSFIDALFNGNVAKTSGSLDGAAEMLNKIAYSALDEGERPFGDTAIRAMFDDANELGEAMSGSSVSDGLLNHSDYIANAFVGYAGNLASNDIEIDNVPNSVLAGIVDLSQDGETLTVSFNNSIWQDAGVSILANIHGRTQMLANYDLVSADGLTAVQSHDIENIIYTVNNNEGATATIIPPTGKVNVIFGGSSEDSITGSSGDDIIIGHGGRDTLVGGQGNDVLKDGMTNTNSIGSHIRQFDGGTGIDLVDFYGTDYAQLDIDLAIGSATATILGGGSVSYNLSNIENVYGSDSNDTITGDLNQNTLLGSSGRDKLFGGDNDDVLYGGADDDELDGGDDDDTYRQNGDFGNDFIVDDGGVLLIDGETPIMAVDSEKLQVLDDDGNLREFLTGRHLELTKPDGTSVTGDHLMLTEVSSTGAILSDNTIIIQDYFINKANWNFQVDDGIENTVYGTNGHEFVHGTLNADVNDLILGLGDTDVIYGYEGNDIIVGGLGWDYLTGGAGNDTFRYNSYADTQTQSTDYDWVVQDNEMIFDFTVGEDKIDVTNLGFTGIALAGAGGNNDLEYQTINVSGTNSLAISNSAKGFYIVLPGATAISNSDFIGLVSSAQQIEGDHSANQITGSEFADTVQANGGDDVVELRGGNDVADGGAGIADKVVYTATSANYTINDVNSQNITLTDGLGTDGVDTLSNFEILEFTDQTLYWDGASWSSTIPDAAPIALNDNTYTSYEKAVEYNVLFNDSDAEDDILDNTNLSINTQGGNGTAVVNNSGTITYTPNAGFSGSDSFTYTLTDSAGGTDTATVSVSVGSAPVNGAPDAVNDTVTVAYETATVLSVLANDSDDETLDGSNISIDSVPVNGAVVVNTDGTITYTPDATYDGTDSFDYTITDAGGNVDTATVSVTVSPEPSNYAPAAEDDATTVLMDGTVDIDVLSNDTDTEDTSFDQSNLSINANPSNGAVSINSNGTIAYTPNALFIGNDSFTYTLTDSGGETSIATVNVSVLADVDPNATATHTGDATNNNITSGSGDDTLFGLEGNDTLYGVSGNDQLVGGLGDDTLKGYKGNDTYIWASGDGNDLIQEANTSSSGTDILHLTGGITLSDLNISGYTSHDLKIEYIPTGEILTLQNQLYYDTDYHIETLTFDDGSSYNLAQGTIVQGGTSSEVLYGSEYDDTVRGGQGNDHIKGESGDDTLYGDLGTDTIYGGTGDDTYMWRIGDGDDLLIEQNYNGSGLDTLHLTDGITLSDIKLYGYTSHDLKIEYLPTGDIITVQNQFYYDTDYHIETLTFDDGSIYDLEQGAIFLGGVGNQSLKGSEQNDVMRGGKDNDTINGESGNDTLYGDLGDDTVYGGLGDDTYIWEAGRGNDLFIEQNYNGSGIDTLYLKGGITFSDLHIYGYTSHDLRIEYTPTGEILTLQNMHYNDSDYHIETLSFDDGSTYDLQTGVQWLGGVGNQHLQGSIYDDLMNGGKDNDTLSGDSGDDTLSGDLGNDSLKGSFGDDMYLWKSGDGNDIFAEAGNSGSTNDVVFLQGGITLADLDMYGTTSHDVKIVHTPTGETITLQNQLHSDTDYHIETIQFEDGTTYNLEQGYEVRGGTGNDNLDGGAYDDTMLGDTGNDTLEGFAGNDVFDGGAGVDKLYGRQGDDVYLWESGDGNDWIYEQNYSGSGSDTLHLTGGIVAADITFSQTGYDLLVNHTPTGESIRIDNQYLSDPDYHVETLLFDNGTTVDLLGI